ncbi:hypothetical protein IW261DRAFT_1424921 [Armillaria novae-zelandiae]|uniref:C2H2-type domain-containing protein n=1 Tax=Armillaria novae-zelandiae TaxID=153914 RepID=A0AA39U0K4_9AGAR|nr:hypothetical protein IW261DRAFT_1424921 [Armillaria novae-zelandiae]
MIPGTQPILITVLMVWSTCFRTFCLDIGPDFIRYPSQNPSGGHIGARQDERGHSLQFLVDLGNFESDATISASQSSAEFQNFRYIASIMDSTYPYYGPKGMGYPSQYPSGGHIGARQDERGHGLQFLVDSGNFESDAMTSAWQHSVEFQNFSPSSTAHASEAGFLDSLSSRWVTLKLDLKQCDIYSRSSTLNSSGVVQGHNTYNHGGRDSSFYGTDTLNAPGTFLWPQPMPGGYEQIIPSHGNISEWENRLTLDARYNFYYQRKIKHVHLNCPLCDQDIFSCNIRQHLREKHHGYCRGERVKCIVCGPSARNLCRLRDFQVFEFGGISLIKLMLRSQISVRRAMDPNPAELTLLLIFFEVLAIFSSPKLLEDSDLPRLRWPPTSFI